MRCPICGGENPEGAQLCASCSYVLVATAGPVSAIAPVGVKTSRLAIASFVLGLLAIFTCFLSALPAIILGIVALVKIARGSGRLKGNGFAITGIVVPVVSFMLPLWMGMLMPALARTRQLAFRMVCGSNVHGLCTSMRMYAADNDGSFPIAEQWCDLLIEYTELPDEMLLCKGAPEGPCNYAINVEAVRLGPDAPPDMVLIFETTPGWNQAGGPELLDTSHHQCEGCNIGFVDGHAEFVRTEFLDDLKWTDRNGRASPLLRELALSVK